MKIHTLGTVVARALSLFAIATVAAFVHWGFDPIPRLNDPRQAGGETATPSPPADSDSPRRTENDPAQNAAQSAVQNTAQNDEGGEAPSDDATGTDEITAEQAPAAAFDPTKLGLEIGTSDAYELWIRGETVFIDARSQDEYEAGHIPFSYLVPPDSLKHGRLGRMMEEGGVFPSARVVLYCEGGSCDASHLVALHLQDMGFERIHIDIEGFPAWQAAGYEVETGPDPILGDVP